MKKVLLLFVSIFFLVQLSLCQVEKNIIELVNITTPVHTYYINKILNFNEKGILGLSNKLITLKKHILNNQFSEDDKIETSSYIQNFYGFDRIENYAEYHNKVREIVIKIKNEALPNAAKEDIKDYFMKIILANNNLFQNNSSEVKRVDCKGGCQSSFIVASGVLVGIYLLEMAECAALVFPVFQGICAIEATYTFGIAEAVAGVVYNGCVKNCK